MTLRTAARLSALILVAGCSSSGSNIEPNIDSSAPPLIGGGGATKSLEGPMADHQGRGLTWRLSDGSDQPSHGAPPPLVEAAPLSPEETAKLLSRLPAVAAAPGDAQDFALRPSTRPPPRAGATIEASFPPAQQTAAAPDSAGKPLTVLRHQPEGPVPMAPRVSVTFSNPMVALTSHAELAKEAVPVKITPEIEGRWRWVGTRTLFFEPEGRAPMATDYTVEVLAGTKDAQGQPLTEGVSWRFSTPPPSLKGYQPTGDSVALTPTFILRFDQRVTPEEILKSLTVRANGQAVSLRPLTPKELASLDEPKDEDLTGRWVAFTTEAPLPKAAKVTVTLDKGTPSAEGPRKTEEIQSWSFRTYGPFKVVEHGCGWHDNCRPLMPWRVELSNTIDEERFDLQQVSVTPELPGMQAEIWGRTLSIRGLSRGRTTYTVTLSPSLVDVFGQRLGESEPLEFKVGPAEQTMGAPDQGMVVLDPSAKGRHLSVWTINYDEIDVSLYKVTPKDYVAYQALHRNRYDEDKRTPPGERVFHERIATEGVADALTEVPIDLSPALSGGLGQVIVLAKPVGAKDERAERRGTVLAWVQATDIGLDAFVDHDKLVGWATSLSKGEPLADLELTLEPQGIHAKTGPGGLTTLKLPASSPKQQMLVARRGADLAFLADSDYFWSSAGQWVRQELHDRVRWLTFDNRKMYRPGERVSLKGWLRLVTAGEKGDVAGLPAGAHKKVSYTIFGSRGNELGKGEATLNRFGGFHLSFDLPKTPSLGRARVHLELVTQRQTETHDHWFDIQEFRRPEFEVAATATEGPLFIGDHATMTVKASYFAGGPLPNAEVRWSVRDVPASFSPPNNPGFIFGTWVPWWVRGGGHDATSSHQLEGLTDASGSHSVQIDFDAVDPPRPTSLIGEGTVIDVNRQSWTAKATLLVHPAEHYVGLRSERRFVEPKEPIEVEAIVTNIEGERLVGSTIHLEMVRLAWTRDKKRGWVQIEVDPQRCELTSAEAPVSCSLTPKLGGTYRVRARITDGRQRRNESTLTVWVAGGQRPPSKKLEMESVELIPAKRDYQPGEVAEVLVQAPFSPATGVYSVRREGLVETHSFSLEGSSHTLKIPIEEWMIPGFHLHVNLSGSAPRANAEGEPDPELPRRPAYASGSLSLRVPPTLRELKVEVTPEAPKTEPGASTSVTLTVTDAQGEPVAGAEVALVAVDEAILALTGYRLPDPLGVFYQTRGPGVAERHLRDDVLLASLDELLAQAGADNAPEMEEASMEAMPAPMVATGASPKRMMREKRKKGAAGEGGDDASPIAVRKDFNPLALFAPEVHTGADGRATVALKLPDNLTRYRLMAIAVHGDKSFGGGESTLTARLPLMVRLSPPRFLNFGDRFELPVVVQNQTDSPLEVKVALRATNAELTEGAGRALTVPPNDRVEVRFPAAAARAGTARFQAGASAGRWADATEVSLPVWTPATTEAFATYGELDRGAITQPIKAPGEVVTAFGGLDITTSSTQLQALTDAVLYLTSYPFECAEQLSSRVLAVAALKDVLTAFDAPGLPSPEAMVAAVSRDIKRLSGMQNSDGGFGFWRRGERSWPFLSCHVGHALARAKGKGFAVPDSMWRATKRHLKQIERYIPSWYSAESRRAIRAYALYVLDKMGAPNPKEARAIIKEAGGIAKVGMETLGWVYPVLSGAKGYKADLRALRKRLNNQVAEQAGTAHFVTSYKDGAHVLLYSSRRVDGLLLEGLIGDQPKSDLIPKLVRGLLAHRVKGRWANTQESAWVLLGLDRYFNTYEKVTPNFVARVWLGEGFAGEHAFKGRTTERHHIEIPMSWLAETEGAQDLTIAKQGPGRLYYRLGMRYAPASLKLAPADYGFHVERTYEATDDPKDVTRDADGRWIVKAGATVKITLTMVAPERRYHVALVDPLPAGFEALNPALKGTASLPPTDGGHRGKAKRRVRRWWWGPWYDHTNLRDERAEAFSNLLWSGVYTYTYFARATTPGQFVVPPPKAEEMYHPETFGRGATAFVTVR